VSVIGAPRPSSPSLTWTRAAETVHLLLGLTNALPTLPPTDPSEPKPFPALWHAEKVLWERLVARVKDDCRQVSRTFTLKHSILMASGSPMHYGRPSVNPGLYAFPSLPLCAEAMQYVKALKLKLHCLHITLTSASPDKALEQFMPRRMITVKRRSLTASFAPSPTSRYSHT
jgi:hypothetical protein